MRKAIFLDKDGTLIPDIPYNVDPSRMRLAPGVGQTLQKLGQLGFIFIVVSNQSGVAKGLFPESALALVFERLKELLAPYRVRLEGLYFCPHDPEGRITKYRRVCDCRKPQPGLLKRAIADYDINPIESWMIGDIATDIEAGRRAGLHTILIDPSGLYENASDLQKPDFIVQSFDQLYNKVAERERAPFHERMAGRQERTTRMDPLQKAIQTFSRSRVLLIGDAALDRYLSGKATRLNREAPVPIVDIQEENASPGCAANVAVNISYLGAHVRFLSVIGADGEGFQLRQLLARAGVDTATVLTDASRHTLGKSRVLSGEHMYVRFDTGTTTELRHETEAMLLRELDRLYEKSDGILLSDYGYGILTPRVITRLSHLRTIFPEKPVLVDSKYLERYRALRPTIVKPNFEEALKIIGSVDGANDARSAYLREYQDRLFERTGAHSIALTLDREGALLLTREEEPASVPAEPTTHAYPIGAGDTYASALLLALTRGLSAREAARIAAAAAAIVVEKRGTAACTNRELLFYFSSRQKQIADLDQLHLLAEEYTAQNKRIVFTNGCFDILHSGHIAYLSAAKKLGDILIVGINTDESIKRLKGASRPVNTLDDRMRVLSGLSSVDHVLSFAEDTASSLVSFLKPDVYVKGGDYSRENLPEARVVEAYGGRVELIPTIPGKSTSTIIEKIQMQSPFIHSH